MANNERSSTWDVAAWGALAGGAVWGGMRSHPSLINAFRAGRRDVAAETAAHLRSMGRFDVSGSISRGAPTDIFAFNLANLERGASPATLKADIASATYESLLSGGQVTHQRAREVYRSIVNIDSVEAAYMQADSAIREHGGNANILGQRLEQLAGEGGFYRPGRLTDISQAAFSPGGFGAGQFGRMNVGLGGLGPEARQLALDVQSKLGFAAKKAGGDIQWDEFYTIRDMIEGQEVVTPFMRGRLQNEVLDIPLANTGVTYGGEHLTSRYITRGAYGATGEIQNYTDRYVNALEQAMATQKHTSGLKNAVIKTNQDFVENLMTEGAIARSQAIWSLPEAVLPAGGRVRSRLARMQAVAAGDVDVDKIVGASLRGELKTPLYPIGSADVVAKGTLISGNIAEQIYGPVGNLFPVERQPLQFVREAWGVTEAAKAAAPGFRGAFGEHFSRLDRKIQGAGYEKLILGGQLPTSGQAYTAPQLLAFYAKPEALEAGELGKKMFAEEMLISGKAADFMEYERVVQKKISLAEGFRVNPRVLSALQGQKMGDIVGLDNPIAGGQFLGIERATGKELWGEAGRAQAEVTALQLSGDQTATLYMREKHKLDRGDWWKFFSEDVKFMGRRRTQQQMSEMLAVAGMTSSVAGQPIEMIASGKLVERNPMAQLTQQVEALSMFVGRKMDQGMISPGAPTATAFLEDPSKFLGLERFSTKRLLNTSAAQAHADVQKNMVALARKYRFTAEEMGLTFGLMDSGVAESLGIADEVARAPGVVGLSKLRLGHLASEGVGGLATIEQTGMRALAMKGISGQRFAAELATRITGKGEMLAADRMMASVLGESDLTEKFQRLAGKLPTDPRKLGQLGPGELLQDAGRYVDVGTKIKAIGGTSRLYIPGMREAGFMAPFVTEKGERMASEVSRSLESLRHLVSRGAAQEELESAGGELRERVVRAAEAQAAVSQKSRVIGSRFLTGIRQNADNMDRAFQISPRTASSMFDDLLRRAKSDEQKVFLTEQKRRLLEDGEELVGGLWRHPTTGPESFQFARYKVNPELADELISAPLRMGDVTIDGVTRRMDLSEMVGFKGDFDKDMFAIAAISDRDTAKRVAKNIDSSIEKGYTDYLFNHYAMQDMIDVGKKKVKAITEMTHQQAIKTGARNLTTAKVATPRVNVALQKLKVGMMGAAPEKYRPMAELFWHLEEAAIGGKHGALSETLYKNIASAVRRRDTTTMESVFTQLLGAEDIEKAMKITLPTGKTIERTMKYSTKELAEVAMSSVGAVSEDVEAIYRSSRATASTPQISEDINQLIDMYRRRRTGSMDVSQAVMQAKDYGMEGFTEHTNRLMRRAQIKSGIVGKALKRARGPVLAGAAVAASVLLAAPSVAGTLPHQEGVRGGRNLQPNDLGPPAGMEMRPPNPRIMTSPKVYDMGGVKMASRANIKMSMSDANRSSDNFMRQARELAANSRVRVKTVDDRSVLSPDRLANKIHERL